MPAAHKANAPMVQIRVSELNALRFRHVRSAIDSCTADPCVPEFWMHADAPSGSTEWDAQAPQGEIFVRWHWAIVRKLIVILNPADIRTNLQLIGTRGRIESQLRTRAHLLEHLERVPWREVVRRLFS